MSCLAGSVAGAARCLLTLAAAVEMRAGPWIRRSRAIEKRLANRFEPQFRNRSSRVQYREWLEY